jgi:serine/threonine protein kinase
MVSGIPAQPGWMPPCPSPLVGGRYEIGPLVGCGGTACVYRAWDTALDRAVAVKLFHPGMLGSDVDRFDQEVAALGRLRHPGVVTPYDAGTHEGRAFLAMELVDGDTLAYRLTCGALDPATTISLGARLAGTLEHVHARGVTHRDLKPANVLLGPTGALITDFGTARVLDCAHCTAPDEIVGTAGYMAPEQVRGEDVGPPADVYSLGLVLLECVTGRREYSGGPVEAAVARLHRAPAVPDGLPCGLTELLRAMTEFPPQSRPTADQVSAELRLACLRDATVASEDSADSPAGTTFTAIRRRRRTRRHALAASLAAALAAGVLAVALPATLDVRDAAGKTRPPSSTSTPPSEQSSAAPNKAVEQGKGGPTTIRG